MTNRSTNLIFNKCKSKQLAKFDKLKITNENLASSDVENRVSVVNLSNRNLSKEEEKVLSLGLNFAITPRTLPKEKLIQEIEPALSKLSKQAGNQARVQIAEVLRRARLPKSNLNKNERTALRQLRQDNSIHVLKADKGNATVIMNRTDYDKKVQEMLTTPTYKKLKKDPTTSTERKVTKHLLDLRNNDSISINLYRRLHPSASTCPKFYGLPKIHKSTVPLRPIVASRGSATYNLAQHLTELLKPLVGNSQHHVLNSFSFIQEIKHLHLDPHDILVSFDVVSLFTNVPVDETCDIIKRKLLDDANLHERTQLSVDEIIGLLKLCLKNTCFQWRDSFYEQTIGAAMGSPLSPVIANIFMEHFEQSALANSVYVPKIWKRYVDDIFAIWPHGKEHLDTFLSYLNNIHPAIKFTIEHEDDQHSLPFLDIALTRNSNGTLNHGVYRKPTHTDRYLNYRSFHHPSIKSSVCKTLVNRAYNVCDKDNIAKELDHLKSVLQHNGFPAEKISLKQPIPTPRNVVKQEFLTSVCIPYLGTTSHQIERILASFGIKVYHCSNQKVYQLLYTHKDLTDTNLKPGIYRIPCTCGKVYIGETGRNLKIRQKEHKDCCRKCQLDKSALAKHSWENDHLVKWDESELLVPVKNYFSRQIRESVEIFKNETIPQEGKPLHDTWTCLFT